jgi:hypothetical protein
VWAVYNGDINNVSSSSQATTIIVGYTTTTTLTSSTNPAMVGQVVTFTAAVTGGASPSGTVSFYDGGNLLGTVTLSSNGQASLALSTLSIGTHSVTATYWGDSTNASSTSSSLSQSVVRASTSLTVSANPNPSVVGQSVAMVANLSGGYGTPTGVVTFYDGSTSLGAVVLSGGQASLNVSFSAVGSHPLSASYGGDSQNAPSNSAAVSQSVQQASSATKLSASSTKVTRRTAVTFSASVTSNPAAVSPTGSVTFYDGSTALATVALTNAAASFTSSSLALGTHTITAVYSGCPAITASTSNSVTVQVTK